MLVVGSAVAVLVGCEEQSGQLTPIDIEKMRPRVEIRESGKALPKPSASEAPQTDTAAAERLPERPPTDFEAQVDEGAFRGPTTRERTEAVAPERPYLEGGDLSPLGSAAGGPTSPGEFTAPGSMGPGL
ncbi:MAG: hypothetical protein AMXMBFR61_07590 [Fimbriimonadales bacterium]